MRVGELDDSSLICRRLDETRVLTCASPEYLKRSGTSRQPKHLDMHEQIQSRNPLDGRPYEWELRRERVVNGKRKVETHAVPTCGRLVVNDVGTLLAACDAGCGIGQALECYVNPHIESGRLVQVLSSWSDVRFPVYVYHHGGLVAARVWAFVECGVESWART